MKDSLAADFEKVNVDLNKARDDLQKAQDDRRVSEESSAAKLVESKEASQEEIDELKSVIATLRENAVNQSAPSAVDSELVETLRDEVNLFWIVEFKLIISDRHTQRKPQRQALPVKIEEATRQGQRRECFPSKEAWKIRGEVGGQGEHTGERFNNLQSLPL